MQKLKFFWRDKEKMTITALLPKTGHRFKHLPGAGSYDNLLIVGKGSHIENYIYASQEKRTIELGKKFLKPDYVKGYFKNSSSAMRRFDAFIKYARNLSYCKLSNKQISELLQRLWDLEVEGLAYYAGSQSEPQKEAEKELKKIISNMVPKKDRLGAFELLMLPHKPDKAQEQEEAWLRLVRNKQGLSRPDFVQHGLKYSFMFRNTYGVEGAYSFFMKKFYDTKANITENELHLEEMKSLRKRKIIKQKELLVKLKSPRARHLAYFFQMSVLERMNLKHVWAGVEEFLLSELFEEVAARIGEKYETMVRFYRPEEILKSLETLKRLAPSEIANRQKMFIFIVKDGLASFQSGEAAINIIKNKFPEVMDIGTVMQIKGIIASSGKASGKAIIISSEGLHKLDKITRSFRKGQILVTHMTQPNMIPLLKKAGAIVTDEGGLTSHAAVVSREFGIPCIVGTQTATKVFKTGDFIEVDAVKGNVRKLKG